MLKLVRTEEGVFYEGRKLTIVPQTSKGVGKEVVKILGLPGSDGAEYISLSRIPMGENEVQPQKRSSCLLTDEEKKRIDELQGEIDAIKAKARQRNLKKVDLKTVEAVMAMDEEARDAYINMLEKMCEKLKGEVR